jgi:RNA polymerase sigma-70 factor (ECF subfamily)
MENNNQDFDSLWLQLKNGNSNAFASIYQAHINALITYGIRLCADENLLKDTIQELFIEIWNSRANLCNPVSVKCYLLKALRYKLIHQEKLRQTQALQHINLLSDRHLWDAAEASVQTNIIDKEASDSRSHLLKKAILALSKRQQEAIQLRFYQGLTNEQIADLMGLNYQSVSNLLHNALIRIKKNIKSSVFASSIAAAFYLFF